MIRSFIAIELKDKDTIENIDAFSSRLKKNQEKLKLVAPENLHLTIKFLGDIHESIVPKIFSILKKEINEKLFQGKTYLYKLKGAGQFNKYSILWIRMLGDIPFIQSIKDAVENLLNERLGIARDKRTLFKPHLTIGRLRKDKINYKSFATLKKIINESRDLVFGIFNISQIMLKKSQLTPTGSIYTDLEY